MRLLLTIGLVSLSLAGSQAYAGADPEITVNGRRIEPLPLYEGSLHRGETVGNRNESGREVNAGEGPEVVVTARQRTDSCLEANISVPGDAASNDVIVIGDMHGEFDGGDYKKILDLAAKGAGKACLALEVDKSTAAAMAAGGTQLQSLISSASEPWQQATFSAQGALAQYASSRGMSVEGVDTVNVISNPTLSLVLQAAGSKATDLLNSLSASNSPLVRSFADERDAAMAKNIEALLKSGCSQVIQIVGVDHIIASNTQIPASYRPNSLIPSLQRNHRVGIVGLGKAKANCKSGGGQ